MYPMCMCTVCVPVCSVLCRVKRFCSVQFLYDSAQEPVVGHPSPTPLVVRRGSDVVLHVRMYSTWWKVVGAVRHVCAVHGGRL